MNSQVEAESPDPERRRTIKRVAAAGAVVTGAALTVKLGALGEVLGGGLSGGAGPSTGAGGSSFQVPSVTSDPVGAPPGSIWYRSDLGELRVQDGVLGQAETVGTQWANLTGAPYATVSGVGAAEGYPVNNGATYGPDTPDYPGANGLWVALSSLPVSNGRRYGQLKLLPGTYSLAAVPLTNFPFDLGDAIVEGMGPGTVIVGPAGASTFAPPSGEGFLRYLTYQGI